MKKEKLLFLHFLFFENIPLSFYPKVFLGGGVGGLVNPNRFPIDLLSDALSPSAVDATSSLVNILKEGWVLDFELGLDLLISGSLCPNLR